MASQVHSRWCSALKCKHNKAKYPNHSFFSFPADRDRCSAWIQNCGRYDLRDRAGELRIAGNVLCECHFDASQFTNPDCKGCHLAKNKRKRLIATAIPTVFDACQYEKLDGEERDNDNSASDSPIETAVTAVCDANQNNELDNKDCEIGQSERKEIRGRGITTEFDANLSTKGDDGGYDVARFKGKRTRKIAVVALSDANQNKKLDKKGCKENKTQSDAVIQGANTRVSDAGDDSHSTKIDNKGCHITNDRRKRIRKNTIPTVPDASRSRKPDNEGGGVAKNGRKRPRRNAIATVSNSDTDQFREIHHSGCDIAENERGMIPQEGDICSLSTAGQSVAPNNAGNVIAQNEVEISLNGAIPTVSLDRRSMEPDDTGYDVAENDTETPQVSTIPTVSLANQFMTPDNTGCDGTRKRGKRLIKTAFPTEVPMILPPRPTPTKERTRSLIEKTLPVVESWTLDQLPCSTTELASLLNTNVSSTCDSPSKVKPKLWAAHRPSSPTPKEKSLMHLNSNLRCKISRLRAKVRKLQENIHKSCVKSTSDLIRVSQHYLTPTQHAFFSAQIQKPGKHWTSEQKQLALKLYYKCPETYSFLYDMFSLPSIRTLSRYFGVKH